MTSPRAAARRPLPSAVVVGIATLIALLAAGCASQPGPSPTPGPTSSPGPSASPAPTATPSPSASPAPAAAAGPLVSVETRGGHCIGGTCGQIVVLDADGQVHDGLEPPNDLGTVPPGDVTGLTDLIAATDFAAIRAQPFTGTCPVAFDGQEVVFEFTTSAGVERIESCVTEVDLDQPLFEAVAGVLEAFISIPTY